MARSIFQRMVVNPYYFALLLLGLFGLNIYHLFDFDRQLSFSMVFFLIYAFGQSLLEVLALTFISNLIGKYFHKSLYYIFIGLCLLCVFLHYIDFFLIRFMDFSIFFGIDIILDETLDNFIELLYLSGISLNTWIFMGIALIVFLPLVALILHYFTSQLSLKKPLWISQKQVLKAFFCVPIGLVILDLIFSPFVDKEQFRFYKRILPWKSTFITPKDEVIQLGGVLKPPLKEKQALKKLHLTPVYLEKKPNIYLFVVESLREDYLTEETAPNIVDFRNENIQLGETFSNANCTQQSWHAIFHSSYPFYWRSKKKNWKSGSIPLQTLKKLGYQIHVYSAAQLKYYGVGETIFGKKNHLADSYHFYPHYPPVTAAEADQKAIDQLINDHKKKWAQSGNLFLIFLDSTHFNYSWPKDSALKFLPISEKPRDFRVSNAFLDVKLIKNRYRNAIYYVDSLFGKLIRSLKNRGIYADSLIVFTGDHGEEFFEEGQLFHGSHLSEMQTRPPIYYKLGDNWRAKECEMTNILSSHIDIFPTLIDQLIGDQPFFELFDGESIFKEKRFPYIIAGRHNGARPPGEFLIYNGKTKLIAKFPSKNIFCLKTLKIISLKDLANQAIPMGTSKQIESYLKEQFEEAFQHIFTVDPSAMK